MSLDHPILAIDHGASRIGLAISDSIGILAHPVETVLNNEGAIPRIIETIHQRGAKSIIIGLPLHMDGSEGKATLKIRNFANRLKAKLTSPLPFEFVDERLTTVSASNKLREAGKKAKNQKDIIDQAAAVEILNNYMQSQENPYGLLENPDDYPI